MIRRTPLAPWEQMPQGARALLAEVPGARLKRVMYGPDTGAVPDDAFLRDCAAADERLDALRAEDPADAGSVYAGLSFTAVAANGDAMARARTEYYLCDGLIDYMQRRDLWYARHPALDLELQGRYPEEVSGPAPMDSLEAALIETTARLAADNQPKAQPD